MTAYAPAPLDQPNKMLGGPSVGEETRPSSRDKGKAPKVHRTPERVNTQESEKCSWGGRERVSPLTPRVIYI